MRLNLLFGFLVFTQIISAQSFTEMHQFPELDGVSEGSVALADVDSDGDDDILITGHNNSFERISKLYINDGAANFTEMTGTPFEGAGYSSAAFADVDLDGDEDVLITGQKDRSDEWISKLYANDGAVNFTEINRNSFNDVVRGSVAFSDVDSDGDPDVLITGYNYSRTRISKMFINDGEGNFTEMKDTPFEGVSRGSVAFSDVDGDGDEDVLITGQHYLETGSSRLYINDGEGNFSEMTGTPFESVLESSVAFSDVDNDGDQDVLITGQSNSDKHISKLYTNDGFGNFTKTSRTPFEQVARSSVAFSDVDGDGDEDVLITGQNNSKERISKLYTNDGTGNFTEMTGTPFPGVRFSSVAFSDLDNDGDQDILISGQNSSFKPISKIYTNNAIVSSTEQMYKRARLDMKAYPNPTNSSTIQISHESTENNFIIIKVFDINGRLIIQQKEFALMGQQNFTIGIAALPPGSYFIQFDKGKKIGSAKFIVE